MTLFKGFGLGLVTIIWLERWGLFAYLHEKFPDSFKAEIPQDDRYFLLLLAVTLSLAPFYCADKPKGTTV